jgi:hypothetical protein
MRPPLETIVKPFAYFDRNTGTLRFETLRDLRKARIGEPREIPIYTSEQVDSLKAEIVRLENPVLVEVEHKMKVNGL